MKQDLWSLERDAIPQTSGRNTTSAPIRIASVLPEYKDDDWPPPSGIKMGQSPGTHWYHAHKHGSTAINVANGMTGVFIIEGDV